MNTIGVIASFFISYFNQIFNAFVLSLVKVEHRLTLFYLANDVIQYSKRKNYEFVESWGTALQRATTMVRYVLFMIEYTIFIESHVKTG